MLQKLLSSPRLYDAVQRMAGRDTILSRISRHLAECGGTSVLDVGAGTGVVRRWLPEDATYLWLDNDWKKLRGFSSHRRKGDAVIFGDASALALATKSVDTALCMFVSHHLDSRTLTAMLRDLSRIVRQRLILIDPLHCPARLTSRLLWAVDRGSYPRDAAELKSSIEPWFLIRREEQFQVFHNYFLCIGEPR
jgi:ubiquinone/menaquinone biosynthesis C-methylase UbiE